MRGVEIVAVINETLKQLREWIKHGHQFKDADEALAAVRQRIYDELAERSDNLTD